MQQTRFPQIDSLRGIAALAVCWLHLTIPTSYAPLRLSGSHGNLGVQVFFVISGFVIPWSLDQSKYRLRDFPRFLLKRVMRLDPPYLATIALTVPLAYAAASTPGFAGEWPGFTFAQVAAHLAYLNALIGYPWVVIVFWTLAIEFQFYLSVGLIYPLIAHQRQAVRLGTVALLCAIAPLSASHSLLIHWLSLFGMGMLTFHYLSGRLSRNGYLASLALCTLAALGALEVGMAIAGLGTALLIAFSRWQTRPLLLLGRISYSLYLLHAPIGTKVVNLGLRAVHAPLLQIGVSLLGTAASLLAAWCMYSLIERPAQRLSSRIAYAPATVDR